MDSKDLIFALDIGTRTVIGVVGIQEKDKFRVIDTEIIEHKSRSMMDGQIHNIDEVAGVVRQVRERLEERLHVSLDKVAIAAAGRVLKTKQVKLEIPIDSSTEISQKTVDVLETEGIQLAQNELDRELSDERGSLYYCVGYSVINYFLNNYVISSLLGHKGKSIGAEILATFLPHTVIDSLYTVMSRVGLEVANLTLEPIAAINVAIPPELRMLNLALVDIGAGTSDIAITKNGSVVAYGMVPVAGDEITEAICQKYLLDFNTGEKIKVSLSSAKGDIKFIDIMGIKQVKSPKEIKEVIKPAVEHIADMVSERIAEFNQKAPNAVFLVGGGSQVDGIAKFVAEKLHLPEERVAVRSRDVIQNVKIKGRKLSGPEAVTPIGIAVTAQMQRDRDFLNVTVNDRNIRLYNSKKLTAGDALILAGIKPGDLIGRTGKSLSFRLNGEDKTVRGEIGTPGKITINGEESNLRTLISSGDRIEVITALEGSAAEVTLSEILEYYQGERVEITVNGERQPNDYKVNSNDDVIVVKVKDLGEVQEPQRVKTPFANKRTEDEAVFLHSDKSINEPGINIVVNGKGMHIDPEGDNMIFVDVFKYIDFDINKTGGGNVVLKLNGNKAAYTDLINEGDTVEIYWENDLH